MGIINRIVSLYIKKTKINKLNAFKNRGMKIGENVHIGDEVIIDYSHCELIEIGNNVTLAPRVHILAHDASTKKVINFTKIGKIKIEDNVFVGAGVIILPGVTIGENSIVGAGSVVSKSILANSVVMGSPAKVLCSTEVFKEKHEAELKKDLESNKNSKKDNDIMYIP